MEETENKDQKEYEVSFLTKSEGGTSAVLKLIKQHQFEVTSESSVRRINLAYKVKKETEGYFGSFHIKGSSDLIRALDHDLKTNPEIIRSLVITPPFTKTKAVISPKIRMRPTSVPTVELETKTLPLTNEALEKKIEEILQ